MTSQVTSKSSKNKFIFLLIILVVAMAISGYIYDGYLSPNDADAAESKPDQAEQQQAMPVEVLEVNLKDIQVWKDFSGTMTAVNIVNLRPQVSGTIRDIRFEDGQMVEKGDVLVVIDPEPYEAAVEQAKADLQAARNDYAFSKKELTRAEELIKTKALSQRILEERQNAVRVANASILGAKARLKRAQVDLDRAYIKAPISGRTGRVEITEGNLVEAAVSSPLITTIVSNDGIYADFEVDEQTYVSQIRNEANSRETEQNIPVRLSLDR